MPSSSRSKRTEPESTSRLVTHQTRIADGTAILKLPEELTHNGVYDLESWLQELFGRLKMQADRNQRTVVPRRQKSEEEEGDE